MEKVKIYSLSDPITKEVMYVGRTKTKLCSRMSSHYHCSRHFSNPRDIWISSLIAQGLKPIITLIEDVDEDIWREREKHWIAFYRNINPNLTNLAIGGEGPTGVKREEDFVRNMSEIKSKPVYQLDSSFRFIKEYPSCKIAVIETKIPHIGNSARSRGRRSAGGFVWIYKDEYQDFIIRERRKVFKIDHSHLYKRIGKFDNDNHLIESWDSAKQASIDTGYHYQSIMKAARGYRKTYKRFIWRYLEN